MKFNFFIDFDGFVLNYEQFISNFAKIIISTLEIIGIAIIFIGALKATFFYIKNHFAKDKKNIKIALGNTLALGLEFKMGAEIIKTVIIRNIDELLILGLIVILRTILAVLIHWEISVEKKEEKLEKEEQALQTNLKITEFEQKEDDTDTIRI